VPKFLRNFHIGGGGEEDGETSVNPSHRRPFCSHDHNISIENK